MMTVKEVSKLTGVSVRTLHYYDEIGLLTPAVTTEAGYRLYDDTKLERLQQILLFKELEFSLKDIKKMIDSPGFDRRKALSEQIELLTLKKEHFENLISHAQQIRSKGEYGMDFKVFDKVKIETYKAEAKRRWGDTEAYREYETKSADYSEEKQQVLARGMMDIFVEFGQKAEKSPADPEVQKIVKKLQDFITANYYTCTKQILSGLGQMYAAGGEMTDNIDTAGGKGTAEFAARAIAEYCK
ncbi:MAG: MerR family transcriptional regulator [Clostridia bacterium]|nr:MerR family transcriptional regulator [Clostridia bacterium]